MLRYYSTRALLVVCLATPVAAVAQAPEAPTATSSLSLPVDSLRFDLAEAAKKPRGATLKYDEFRDAIIVSQIFALQHGGGLLSLSSARFLDGQVGLVSLGKTHEADAGTVMLSVSVHVDQNGTPVLDRDPTMYVIADGERFQLEKRSYDLERDATFLREAVSYVLTPAQLLAFANALEVRLRVGPYEFKVDNRSQKAFRFVAARLLTRWEVD